MNYLSDNVLCVVNGKLTKIAVIIAEGRVIFFFRSRKDSMVDNLMMSAAGIAGMTAGVVALPVAIVGLVAISTLKQEKKAKITKILEEIRQKFKVPLEEIFISDPERCTVKLSGKKSLIPGFSNSKILIEGAFLAGAIQDNFKIDLEFSESPNSIKKFFEKGELVYTDITA